MFSITFKSPTGELLIVSFTEYGDILYSFERSYIPDGHHYDCLIPDYLIVH